FPNVISNLFGMRGETVTVDPVPTLTSYWQTMYLGVAYEKCVHSQANRDHANIIAPQNYKNSRRIHARGRGFSEETFGPLLGVPLKELEAIPLDADLFETKEFDKLARKLFCTLCMRRGIGAANATKILYQKRPRLFPILDQYFRCAIDLPWIGKDS